MASRVKKLFRRKKDDSLTEQESPPRDLPRRAQRSTGGTNNSSLRHSLYEDTAPGMYPQTGDYPLRGADGSQYDLPRGKNHGRQNASTSDLTYSQPTAKSRESHERPSTSRQPRDPSLSREFAGLNFDEGQHLQDSSRVANKPLRHLLPGNLPPGQYVEDVADRNAGNIRHSDGANESSPYVAAQPRRHAPYSSANIYDRNAISNPPDLDVSRNTSVQRKQVGSGLSSPISPTHSNSLPNSAQHQRQSSLQKPLPTPLPEVEQSDTQRSSIRKVANGPSANLIPAAEDVVRRAKGNSYDTEVIEKVAPAVVHETVHKDIHHIREEVITREIHNHEVYHRILPVIDVEVLPARHFLPVQGGGLVEISASEVPSRGRNWIIAETASKIPSDESAPTTQLRDRFSARQFIGTEGDAKRYITPEGWEKTEETWVHPPELETGARDSGQTWPMEFGTLEEGRKHTKSPANGKHHSRRRSSMKQPTAQNIWP